MNDRTGAVYARIQSRKRFLGHRRSDPDDVALVCSSLELPNLTLKNRILRSSISGHIDNYNGSGTLARRNFEKRFSEGGVGAIITSHVPIHPSGRVLPNYAMIDCDELNHFLIFRGPDCKEMSLDGIT